MFEWLIGLFDGKIIEYILGVIITFLGWRWIALKSLIKEMTELTDTLGDALEDDAISDEEKDAIIKEAKEVLEAIRKLFEQKTKVEHKLKML